MLIDPARATLSVLFLCLGAAPSLATSGTPPTAFDDAYTTGQDDNLSVDEPGVLGNDFDPEGDPLHAVLVDSSEASGVLLLFDDGSFEYEVAPGFVGVDRFTYVAFDGTGSSAPATVEFTVSGGTAGGSTYTAAGAFATAVANQGWSLTDESFESSVWPRSPVTSQSVSNLGLTWSGNNSTSQVTTGPGPALFGQYGFFQLPHGNYTSGAGCLVPGACTDGWIVSADSGRFTAAGMWIKCNAGTAGIEFWLDGDAANPIDFGGVSLPAGSVGFFGVIDPQGFQALEVHETEGTSEDASFLFGDLFRFVLQDLPEAVPYGCGGNPAGSLTVLSGAPQVGTTLVVGVDNPLATQASGSLPLLALAGAPAPGFPCGTSLPGYGMAGGGAAGELLLSIVPPDPFTILVGAPWIGPGNPAGVALAFPANPSLVGKTVYAQGVLLDPQPLAQVPLGLAEALELRIGL